MRHRLSRALRAYYRWFMVYVDVRLIHIRLRRFKHLFHGTVLDLGAGSAPYRIHFNVERYYGANARSYYLPTPPVEIARATDVWIDGRPSLPFKDASLDGVVCFQVLSIIEDPNALFREFARVLKSGSYLLVTTNFLYPKWADDDRFRHTDTCLRELAETNGFDVTAIQSLGGVMTTLHCLAMRLIRDAPGNIRRRSPGIMMLLRGARFLVSLLVLPAWAVAAWIIICLDRKREHDFSVAMNLLLIAQRRP